MGRRARSATSRRRGARSATRTTISREALRAFEAVEAEFEIARTRLDLAELAHARGDASATAAHLAEAARRFRALGVPRWVERVEERVRAWGAAG